MKGEEVYQLESDLTEFNIQSQFFLNSLSERIIPK